MTDNSWTLFLDESSRNSCLTVAGFIVNASKLISITETWRRFKEEDLGIDPNDELKHTFAKDHPTRRNSRKIIFLEPSTVRKH